MRTHQANLLLHVKRYDECYHFVSAWDEAASLILLSARFQFSFGELSLGPRDTYGE